VYFIFLKWCVPNFAALRRVRYFLRRDSMRLLLTSWRIHWFGVRMPSAADIHWYDVT
jgi:hypothetical protein